MTDCGDDIKAGNEICDNVYGCDDECQAELGFECTNANACTLKCGNGKMDIGEDCEDTTQEGCSEHCKAVCGWDCGTDGICNSICGDGLVVGPDEECDHWGLENMGCDLDCKQEFGYVCTDNECETVCGDGDIAGDEECDPNNSAPNMALACTQPLCKIADEWRCDVSNGPLECYSLCGNGEMEGTEGCDDNNTVSGDGCSNECELETGYMCWPIGNEPVGYMAVHTNEQGTYQCGIVDPNEDTSS